MFGQQFRIFCGFSPSMSRSCWYETNLPNLWRYAQNRLRNLFYDRDADVSRVLRRIAPDSQSLGTGRRHGSRPRRKNRWRLKVKQGPSGTRSDEQCKEILRCR